LAPEFEENVGQSGSLRTSNEVTHSLGKYITLRNSSNSPLSEIIKDFFAGLRRGWLAGVSVLGVEWIKTRSTNAEPY
jgi:hypothetical protein